MSKEPNPRFGHFSAVVGNNHYVFGGFTPDFSEKVKELAEEIHVLKDWDQDWETVVTTGKRPPALYHGNCTSLNNHIFIYGGSDSHGYQNCLYQLDTLSMEWSELPSGPMKKSAGGLVGYDDKLLLFAGTGHPTDLSKPQPGAEFAEHHKVQGLYYSNEMDVFDLSKGSWFAPDVSGDRPRPCNRFSFTKIDDYTVLLFGGVPSRSKINDVYQLDLRNMHWNLLDISGPRPLERDAHAAACVGYGKDDPQLLITGGLSLDGINLADLWILNVQAKKWREVNIQGDRLKRHFHSATSVCQTPLICDVVVFGGCPKWTKNYTNYFSDYTATTNLSVLQFEYHEHNSSNDSLPTKTWVLREPTPVKLLTTGDLTIFKEKFGVGAFASVFRAEYKGKVCAAKILSPTSTEMMIGDAQQLTQGAAEAIKRECAFLEHLSHENIIQHITTAIEPRSGLPILVMELMDCSLKRFIPSYRPLNIGLQLTICRGISSGLNYLHSKNIIHRDLCDDNILLMRPPELRVKIADFGMSKILKCESVSVSMTAVGARFGYLPPEGRSGGDSSDDEAPMTKVSYSHPLDIYSFGAIATQTVQSSKSIESRKHLKQTFRKIPDTHPLKKIIGKCIEKDCKERPEAEALCSKIASIETM